MGLENGGFNSEVVLISSGLNSGILLYHHHHHQQQQQQQKKKKKKKIKAWNLPLRHVPGCLAPCNIYMSVKYLYHLSLTLSGHLHLRLHLWPLNSRSRTRPPLRNFRLTAGQPFIVCCGKVEGSFFFLSFFFTSLVAIAGTFCFCPVCLLVCLFVCWTTLTLVTNFEPFQIEPSYMACRFLVTVASHSYKQFFDLWPWPSPVTYFKEKNNIGYNF